MIDKFTESEIRAASEGANDYSVVAKRLTALGRGTVSRQLARWWVLALEDEVTEVGGSDVSYDFEKARMQRTEVRLRADLAQERKLRKALVMSHNFKEDFTKYLREELIQIASTLPAQWHEAPPSGRPITVEVLVSDWQIGKLSPDYNSQIAISRMQELCRAIIFQITQKITVGYKVERIVIALLGDIIESDKKHANSARSTDCGTAEQSAKAINHLFKSFLLPLAHLNIPLEVHCVTGNHDHDGHGMMSYQPGKEHLSHIIYSSLEQIVQAALPGYDIRFIIPRGSFSVAEFYGQRALYEHGVGVSVTEQSMKRHKAARQDQLQKYITYFRMGDKHNVTSFNAGQYVVNGSFFGTDTEGAEYSSQAGYCSIAAQWVGFHVARSNDKQFTLYDNFVVQLGHVV